MKLSTKGRYGLRAMIDLARYSEEMPVSISCIAARQGLSEGYLEQLVALLRKAGLVKSIRGASGGYVLTRAAKEISVGDILRALEGSLEPRPVNVAVYCTSNRRHLVRQNFSDRDGDEIDASETIQDKTSLADRFGLRILFSELTKPQFIEMALDMAQAKGIQLDRQELHRLAVRWEARHTSRSPRSALQFVSSLQGQS